MSFATEHEGTCPQSERVCTSLCEGFNAIVFVHAHVCSTAEGTALTLSIIACEPIELVGKFAAGPASMAFPPSSMCFGAVTYLIGAAKGTSADLDAISGLMATLRDFTVRLKVYNIEALPIELQRKLAEILAVLLQVFARATNVIKHRLLSRLKSFGTNVLLGSDRELQGLVAQLNSLTDSEAKLTGAETYTLMRQATNTLDGVSLTVNESHAAIQDSNTKIDVVSFDVHQLREEVVSVVKERKAEDTKNESIKQQEHAQKNLLPSLMPKERYSSIVRSRVEGTGDWLRDEPDFQAWMQGSADPILYMFGIPGAGKSYVSDLHQLIFPSQHPRPATAQQDSGRVLSSWLTELA